MAKQIKVIQCPQCGSTKPVQTRPDHYRCDKCGTEFFLDTDDININVNHNIPGNEPHQTFSRGVWVGLGIVLVVALLFLARMCGNAIRHVGESITTYRTYETPPGERNKYLLSTLLPAGGGESVALYLENRAAAKDSTYAVFRNVTSAEILNEQAIGRGRKIAHRYFVSDSTDYLIVDGSRIYTVDAQKLALTDVTGAFCARKPALEAGLMSVEFVDEGTGEGFRMNTNLGKELFYFPASDVLCTENAYKFMATDNDKGILPGAENRVYYLFQNKESAHSSNVAQLMEVTYLFNNGGPENKLREITGGGIGNPGQHRIASAKAITDELVCFSPAVLWSDDRNILVSFRPTLAPDAVVNVQLFDTAGNIVWTVAFTSDFQCSQAIRTGRGYLLQTSENSFWEIGHDGQNATNYTF